MKLHHFALEVSDLSHSCSFYQELFGFQLERTARWKEEKIAFLTKDSFRLELIELGKVITQTHFILHLKYLIFPLSFINILIYLWKGH